MKRTHDICRLASLMCSMAFVWAIAVEVDILPRLLKGDLFRWQVMLVGGVALWVIADRLAELRCRCCGSDDVLLRAMLFRSREMLCRRCLFWNPVTTTATGAFAVPMLPSERLNPAQRSVWKALWRTASGKPVHVIIRLGRARSTTKALRTQSSQRNAV